MPLTKERILTARRVVYGNYATIMIKFSMDQFCILRSRGVKFGENRLTFNPCPHIKFPLQIHVCGYQ